MKITDVKKIQLGSRWFELQLLEMEFRELLVDEDLQVVDYFGNYLSLKEVKENEPKTIRNQGS